MTEHRTKLLEIIREYGQLAVARSLGAEKNGDSIRAARYDQQAQGYAELAVLTEQMVVYRRRLPNGKSVFFPW